MFGLAPKALAQSVTYSHDDAKMNQITVAEIGSGGLTPAFYYQLLHNSYQKSAAAKNKLGFRTAAGINLYNQVDDAEALDSAMTQRARIEALNVTDRSGGALDVAWLAEGEKVNAALENFERNIRRITEAGAAAVSGSFGRIATGCTNARSRQCRKPICPIRSARNSTSASMRTLSARMKP